MTPSFLSVRGREWRGAAPRHRRALLTNAFEYWRRRGFPYYDLARSEIVQEFAWLQAQPPTAAFRKDGALVRLCQIRRWKSLNFIMVSK